MSPAATSTEQREQDLLRDARNGDEGAFRRLIEPFHGELHAQCYRMLGSVHDAEDALQETLLRAWRGLARFEGRSSLRSWLYTIATNTSLNLIERRPKRVLPIDYGPAADPHDGPGEPLVESAWVEPYPADALGLGEGLTAPEARFELRESVELAFIAALQLLPPNQRAVLIMREVLGFSAQDTANALETSVASVNSALQRARKTVEERLPEQSQQATLRSLGDENLNQLVGDYVEAMDRGDVGAVVSMLAEDAAWSMPPLATWFRGTEGIRDFLAGYPLSGAFRWKRMATRASGQIAVGAYTWKHEEDCFRPFALDVLTLEGSRIKEVTAFLIRTSDLDDREMLARWPHEPVDEAKVATTFQRFGLPDRLDP